MNIDSNRLCAQQDEFHTRRCGSGNDCSCPSEDVFHSDGDIGWLCCWTGNIISDAITTWRSRAAWLDYTMGYMAAWDQKVVLDERVKS